MRKVGSRLLFSGLIIAAITVAASPRIAFSAEKNSSKAAENCGPLLENKDLGAIHSKLNDLATLHEQLKARFGAASDHWMGALTYTAAQSRLETLKWDENKNDPNNKKPSLVSEGLSLVHAQEVNESDAENLFSRSTDYVAQVIAAPQFTQLQVWKAAAIIEILNGYYHSRLPLEEQTGDGSGGANVDGENSKKTKDTQKEDDQEDDSPVEFPDHSDSYDPFNKDTDGKADKRKKVTIIEFSEKVAYFKAVNYNSVNRRGQNKLLATPIPGLVPKLKTGNSSVTMRVNLLGEEIQRTLFVPAGWEPLKPLGRDELVKLPNGNYKIKSKNAVVDLLMKKEFEDLNPIQVEFLKTPVGIAKNEWPDKLKSELLDYVKTMDPLTAAAKVESYLRHKYLYKVDADQCSDPIEALKQGAFQCDFSAFIMVGILRDALGIPSRVVGGYRASSDGKGGSMLRLPATGHAWVEVWHSGKWVTFDPTPVNKDRKTKEESDPDGSGDNQKDFDDEFKTQKEQKDVEEDGKPSDEKKNENSEKKESKKPDSSKEKAKPSDENKAKSEGQKGTDAQDDRTVDEHLEELSIGSLSMLDKRVANKLVSRFYRIQIREALRPDLDSSIALQKLTALHGAIKNGAIAEPALVGFLSKAIDVYQYRQGPLVEALRDIKIELRSKSLNGTYARLINVEDRLNLYRQVLDAEQIPTEQLRQFQQTIKAIKERYFAIVRAGFEDVNLVQKFLQNVPPHTAALFKQRHKISTVGFNVETQNAAKALRKGADKDYNLIRVLYPMTNFITDSVPSPAFSTALTWNLDTRYSRGPHLMPLSDLSKARKAILLDPNKDVYDNMREGKAFVKERRRRINVPNPGGKTDPQRITIALYDVSGSMSGDPGEYQAGLMAAFVDRALSDRGISGNYRHKAVLMGFGTEVSPPQYMLNSQDAYDLIRDYKQLLGNKGSGTDIEKALTQAMLAILDAQQKNGEPLAAANIILMSDGGSQVKLDNILKLRRLISEKTPIKIMFVGINGTNPELLMLSQEIGQLGFSEVYPMEKTAEDIKAALTEANSPLKVDTRRDYHSDRNPSDLSKDTESLFLKAASELEKVTAAIFQKQKYSSLDYWDSYISRLRHNPSTKEDKTPYDMEIQILQGSVLHFKPFKERKTIEIVMDDIMRNLEVLTTGRFNTMTNHEKERTRHLLKNAMDRAAGKKIN